MRFIFSIFSILMVLGLFSCEEVVDLKVPNSNQFVVVDAQLTNLPGNQVIRLVKSQNYFDNGTIEAIKGAKVQVLDTLGNVFEFKESLSQEGIYEWKPIGSESIGKVGRKYVLKVDWNGEHLEASTKMYRVPPIDSIRYKKAKANLRQSGEGKPTEGFEAQFYASDPKGVGDCYRLKVYKNDKLFNEPNNLTVMYDSNFQKGAQGDGLMFILPVRSAISPELYEEGNKLRVEIWSISEGEFDFYFQARSEINNAGLFSRPAANIPSNLINTNKNSAWQGAGWFGFSSVSSLEVKVEAKNAVNKLY